MNGWSFLEVLLQDTRYAGRVLLRSPGFAITAILALALGIGANTAIFTVLNKVLLEPLPYRQPDRLVELELGGPQGNADVTSIPKFNVWRKQARVFEAVAAYSGQGPGINLTGVERPQQLTGTRASADFFPVFGVPMEIGRPYTEEEDVPGGPKLVVLSYGFWLNQFGGDPNIVGKTLELSGEAYVVSGVVGSSFDSSTSDGYLPAVGGRSKQHGPISLLVVYRPAETRCHASDGTGGDESRGRRVSQKISR